MSVNEAVSQLLEVVKNRDLKGESPGKVTECYPKNITDTEVQVLSYSVYQVKSCTYYFFSILLAYTESTIAVGLARVGAANQQIVCGSMKELLSHDLGPPLHSLIIPGHLHFIEKDMLRIFALNPNILDES